MCRILLCLLLLQPLPLLAAPQYSKAECQKLNAQRLDVRKQLRQPYNAEQGKALTARERELQRVLNRHCKKPKPNPPALPQ